MKKFFTLATRLLFILFFPLALSAQENPDYRILLHSGEFVPEKNISTIAKSSAVLQNSYFDGKYYVTIQFNSLPDNAMKKQLKLSGIELIDYIPNNAFTAAVSANVSMEVLRSFPVRSVFQFTPSQKTVRELLDKQVPAYASPLSDYADVTVLTYEKISLDKVIGPMNSVGAIILEDIPIFRNFTIRVPKANLEDLVALPFVQWTEFRQGPKQNENLPGRTLHRVNVISDGPRNLKGDGINVGIWDEGEISPHVDFLPTSRLTQVEFSTPSQHSTHCSGTILGRGLIDPFARGMAPNAKLYSWNFNGNIQTEMAAGIPANNLIVSSHSYNDGTIIGGSLGEASTITEKEKEEMTEFAVEYLNGKIPVIVNIAESRTKDAIQQAANARKWGADGIMLLPPMRYKTDDKETITYFKTVAASTELSIMIYNNPVDYKIDTRPELFEMLVECQNITALKESSRDVTNLTRMKNLYGDRFKILCGVDTLAMEELCLGADGWVAGLVCAFPKETVAIYNLVKAGKIAEATVIYRWFMPLLELDIHPKLVQYIKLAAAQTGIGSEYVRAPRLLLEGEEREWILKVITGSLSRRPKF